MYVNPTLPPATPEGEALLRTSYMATHTEALLDEAMDIMAEVMAQACSKVAVVTGGTSGIGKADRSGAEDGRLHRIRAEPPGAGRGGSAAICRRRHP